MSLTWHSEDMPPAPRITWAGWLRASLRGMAIAALVLLGLAAIGVTRLVERPVHGVARPWTPRIVQLFSRGLFVVMGLRCRVSGRPVAGARAIVSNHVSWLDIFALYIPLPATFVSKSEVSGWPVFGFLARVAGTLFIQRQGRQSGAHRDLIAEYLNHGHRIVIFPEGTSTDGQRVIPFKSTIFAAFFTQDMKCDLAVQPVTLRYVAPPGEDARFYGWFGDMDFASSVLKVLAQRRQGAVRIQFHSPLNVADFDGRKTLAGASESAVRAGLDRD